MVLEARALAIALTVIASSTLVYASATASEAVMTLPKAIEGGRMIPADEDRVSLGRSFNGLTGKLVGFGRCIEGYQSAAGGGPDTTIRLLEVTDQFSLMNTLDIDVAAQGGVFGSKVSGKGKFVASVKLTQNTQNFAIYARADRAAETIAPAEGRSNLNLTAEALGYLEQGQAHFREKCGDSFVAAIYEGAEVYGVLSFFEQNREKRQQIRASMEVSSTGWSASASAERKVAEYSDNKRLQIYYSQRGGGEAPESNWSSIKQAASQVTQAAKGPDARQVSYKVVPYGPGTVGNWPGEPLTPSPELVELVYYRGAYGTIRETLNAILEEPETIQLRYVLGRGTNHEDLRDLRKEVQDLIARTNKKIDSCTSWTSPQDAPADCSDTATLRASLTAEKGFPHPYAVMARLPIMFEGSGPREYFLPDDALRKLVFDRNLQAVHDAACSFQADLPYAPPGCIENLREKFMPSVEVSAPVPPTGKAYYVFRTQSTSRNLCMTAQPSKSTSQVMLARTCNLRAPASANQRFHWNGSGQLVVRSDRCMAGANKIDHRPSPHRCDTKEPYQVWRFVPKEALDPAAREFKNGMLQNAHGWCLGHTGTQKYIWTRKCTGGDDMLWTAHRVE